MVGTETALGREEEQRDAPSLIKGTFDEEQGILKINQMLPSKQVRAGTITSGKAATDAFGAMEGRENPLEGGTK